MTWDNNWFLPQKLIYLETLTVDQFNTIPSVKDAIKNLIINCRMPGENWKNAAESIRAGYSGPFGTSWPDFAEWVVKHIQELVDHVRVQCSIDPPPRTTPQPSSDPKLAPIFTFADVPQRISSAGEPLSPLPPSPYKPALPPTPSPRKPGYKPKLPI